jgi:glycosyltransferase involved in cell wall biosynthesis
VEVVFTKEGKGAGYARNVGMEHAVGKWLVFADADDYFHPCIADLMDDYRDAEEDVVYFKHDSCEGEWRDWDNRIEHLNSNIDSYFYDLGNGELLLRYYLGVPWSNFVKNKLVKKNQIKFTEILKCNDTMFAFLIGESAKSICSEKRVGYLTVHRKDSLEKIHGYKHIKDNYLEREKTLVLSRSHRLPLSRYKDHLFDLGKILEAFEDCVLQKNAEKKILFSKAYESGIESVLFLGDLYA